MTREILLRTAKVGLAGLFAVLVAWGCTPMRQGPGGSAYVKAQSSDFLVVVAGRNDTLRSLAATFLGNPADAWVIGQFNDIKTVRAGQEVVIPRTPTNPAAVFGNGYQTVPILSYHRFGPGKRSRDRLELSAESFEAQMAYLKRNGFQVVGLDDFADFIEGRRSLPRKSVVLTVDDGYRSAYSVAYPILKKYGFRATLFVYTDFVGTGAGLTWAQMKEMVASGLIDIQPHSKSHSNMARQRNEESPNAYQERVLRELRAPASLIKRRLGVKAHTFAYPYGAVNEGVADAAAREGYRLAVTVTRGGNPTFTHPYMVRRTMIYGDDSIDVFAKRLKTFQPMRLP